MLHDGPDDPTAARPQWWAAYLTRHCAVADTERELVTGWFGTDVAEADAAWETAMLEGLEARLPFGGGHTVLLYSCDLPTDWGTEYLVLHPGWGRVRGRLAAVDTRFPEPERQQGPGLSWRELVHLADTPDHAAPGVHDPSVRLLLLLPTLGDARLPPDAAEVVRAALVAVGIPPQNAARLAAFVLRHLLWAPARWSAPQGRRRWGRPWAAGRKRAFAGILHCDAPGSPRFAQQLAHGITPAQSRQLARALGTWQPQ
ncbi:hypothetical protein ACGF0D_18540 [Kitasatospora sp. NPDC048298]|uniref:hypothetical protein n=1 Tax=Kitasatospora sp. NPDC048298 TaxID=3364049 RepID=UPI0037145A12